MCYSRGVTQDCGYQTEGDEFSIFSLFLQQQHDLIEDNGIAEGSECFCRKSYSFGSYNVSTIFFPKILTQTKKRHPCSMSPAHRVACDAH